MNAIEIGRVTNLHTARRTLNYMVAAMVLAPGLVAMLIGGSVQEIIVLVLPLIPLIVLALITAGALDAAACDPPLEHDAPAEFPRPLEMRG